MSNIQSTQPSGPGQKDKLSSTMPSSPGNSPRVMAPHEVMPDQAAWRDRTERPISAKDEDSRVDALLDEANDLSFPASDPIAIPSSPTERDKEKRHVSKKQST